VVLPHPLHQVSLNIRVYDTSGTGLDKGFAEWDLVAHQDVEYVVGLGGIIYAYHQ